MSALPSAEVVGSWNQSLVTVIPEIGLMQVTGPDGVTQVPDLEMSRKDAAARLAAVSAMYLAVGPGEHSLRHVSIHSEIPGLTAASEIIRLSRALPEDVVHYGLSGDGREVIRFGKIAIAGRKPAFDELLLHADRLDQIPTRQTSELKRAETLALDPFKIDLTGFDNVSIRVERRFLHLQLDSPLTFLTARVLGKISHLRDVDRRVWLDAENVAKSIWDSMPLAERALYVKEDLLFGAGSGMGKRVDEILNSLTGMLQITRRGAGAMKYHTLTNNIALRFGQTPHEGPFPENVELLFPPGTNPNMILGEVPDRFLDMARAVKAFTSLTGISHTQAIDVLDVILPSDGRRALHAQIGGTEEDLAAVIEKLDGLARGSLGASYYAARISRTPKSKEAHGSAMRSAPRSGAAVATPRWRTVKPGISA